MDKEYYPSVPEVVDTALNNLVPGYPSFTIDSLKPRNDRTQKEPEETYRNLLEEGSLMGPIDSIELGDGKRIHLSLTMAASPHTPLAVPYESFQEVFKKKNAEVGIDLPEGPLVTYKDSSETLVVPESVPLHMIVWMVLEDEGHLMPVDLTDMAAALTPEPDGSINMDAVYNKFKLQIPDDKNVEIFELLHKKVGIARSTILELYNATFRDHFAIGEGKEKAQLFPEKKHEDILQGMAYGFYRGDQSKMLGQTQSDGLGFAPMSNATAHFHICAHLTMEEINKINLASKHASFADISALLSRDEHKQYFKRSLDLIETKPDYFSPNPEERTQSGMLRKLVEDIDIYEILKLIDPYATVAHEYLSEWLEERAKKYFGVLTESVQLFKHHGGEYDRELRAVEGVEVVVNPDEYKDIDSDRLKAIMYTAAVKLIGQEVAPMWDNVRDFVARKLLMTEDEQTEYLLALQARYKLPDSVLTFIARIQPSEKQLKILLQENLDSSQKGKIQFELAEYHRNLGHYIQEFEKHFYKIQDGKADTSDLSELIAILQKLQLYDTDWNRGYNIPGVPGFAITHNRLPDGRFGMMIGWLLSQKGLMESWSGGSLVRAR